MTVKPVKFTHDGRDVIKLSGLRRHASYIVLRSLDWSFFSRL